MLVTSWTIFLPISAVVTVPWLTFAWFLGGYEILSNPGFVVARLGVFAGVALCAVAVVRIAGNSETSLTDLLRGFARRWALLGLLMLLWLTVHTATTMLERAALISFSGYYTRNPGIMVVDPVLFVLVGFMTAAFDAAVGFVAAACFTAAVAEERDIGQCLLLAFKVIGYRQTALRAAGFCAAFAILWLIVFYLGRLGTASSHSVIVGGAFSALMATPLWGFSNISAILYYIDVRFRQGVDVPARYAADLRNERSEEATSVP